MKQLNIIIATLLSSSLVGCSTFHHQVGDSDPHAIFIVQHGTDSDYVIKIDGKKIRDKHLLKPYRVRSGRHEIVVFHLKREIKKTSKSARAIADMAEFTAQSLDVGATPAPFPISADSYYDYLTYQTTNNIVAESGKTYIIDPGYIEER